MIKRIETEEEYWAALGRLDKLHHAKEGTPAGVEKARLLKMVANFEDGIEEDVVDGMLDSTQSGDTEDWDATWDAKDKGEEE